MNWEVRYAEDARRDLEGIYRHIAEVLRVEETARRQVLRIMDAVDSLAAFPMRHPFYEDEPWFSRGMRRMPVDRYLVFYFTDESRHMVNVARIMYAGRDIAAELPYGRK